jgi:HAL2 family 3'(2'),5'-bisphosphate nucleotidase
MLRRMPSPDTTAALDAIRAACRVCRAVSAGTIERVTKADESPVTVADFASQAVIVARLRERVPDAVVIGEESADELRGDDRLAEAVVAAARVVWPEATRDAVLDAIDAGARRPDHGPYWTLDPIDGTKGFLRREQYAVCLAYVEDATPTIGLLGCPNLPRDHSRALDAADPGGAVYVAWADGPVLEYGVDGDDATPLPVASDSIDGDLVVTISVESGHTRVDHVDELVKHLGRPARMIRCDSQAKYALVTRGQAHVYLRVPTKPDRFELVWDHAAGVAIASRTGMRVTDLRGEPLDFSVPPSLSRNYGIVCAHPAIHGDLVRAIAELGYAGT